MAAISKLIQAHCTAPDWNKRTPGPVLPQGMIDGTAAKYAVALRKLAGITLD